MKAWQLEKPYVDQGPGRRARGYGKMYTVQTQFGPVERNIKGEYAELPGWMIADRNLGGKGDCSGEKASECFD